MGAVVKVFLQVVKALGKNALKSGKILFKAGAKIAPKAKSAVTTVAKFAKDHPNLTKSLIASAVTEYTVDKVGEFLASKGVKTDEVRAFEEFLSKNQTTWSNLSTSDLTNALDNLEVDSSDALKPPRNHPDFWFPKGDKVAMLSPLSPTTEEDYPSLSDVMVRNYVYDLDDYYLTTTANSPVIGQLAQTIAAYYKGLSLEIPTTTQLTNKARSIISACTASFKALSLLISKQRFDSGWFASINNQPGAAGFLLGLYDNSFDPGTTYDYANSSQLPNVDASMKGVLQGIIQTPSGSATPTITTIPANTMNGFENMNPSITLTAGAAITAKERDKFYGVTVSNKTWMELITRIKTLPISQSAANFAHYLFSGVFQASQPKVGSGRDVLVFHMNTSATHSALDTTGSNSDRTILDEIESYLTTAEYHINSDRSIQTILNYLGLYKDLGADSQYSSNSKGLPYDTRSWRSSTFFRTPESNHINIYDYSEDLYKAMINADMRFRARVNYNEAGETVSKAFPMLSWSVSPYDLYWDRQTEVTPGMQFDLRAKYEMVESGTIASALKFSVCAYLSPSWFMRYSSTSTGPIRVLCNIPSFGAWVNVNAVSGAALGLIGPLLNPENIIRPNGDPICFKHASLTDAKLLDAFNLTVDTRIRYGGYSQSPMTDVDSDYVLTSVQDLNTVYDWQYFNLFLGTTSLKPIIDKLQRIEVSAAGRI